MERTNCELYKLFILKRTAKLIFSLDLHFDSLFMEYPNPREAIITESIVFKFSQEYD